MEMFRGISPDLSKYAAVLSGLWKAVTAPQSVGVDKKVSLQWRQTWVTTMRSRSRVRKDGIMARVSGGRCRLMGENPFKIKQMDACTLRVSCSITDIWEGSDLVALVGQN